LFEVSCCATTALVSSYVCALTAFIRLEEEEETTTEKMTWKEPKETDQITCVEACPIAFSRCLIWPRTEERDERNEWLLGCVVLLSKWFVGAHRE